jgi:hypothetical protein
LAARDHQVMSLVMYAEREDADETKVAQLGRVLVGGEHSQRLAARIMGCSRQMLIISETRRPRQAARSSAFNRSF